MMRRRLRNGLRVVLEPNKGKMIAVVVAFATGSRDDLPQKGGRRHALEHLLVGPTQVTPDPVEFARRYEPFVKTFNAETDETSMMVYIETDAWRFRTAARLIAEVIRRPYFSKQLFADEMERIKEEIRIWNDSPDASLEQRFDRLMYYPDSLANSPLGTIREIEQLTLPELRLLHRRILKARRMVIVVTGGFNPSRVMDVLEDVFGDLPSGHASDKFDLQYQKLHGRIRLHRQPFEQVRCMIGWPVFGFNHPDRYILSVLAHYLTGLNSSPIRVTLDNKGHGYSCESQLYHWQDVGQYTITIGLAKEKLLTALQRINKVITQVQQELIDPGHLSDTVDNLSLNAKGKFNDQLESAQFFARQIINLGQAVPLREYLQAIRSVRRAELRRVARDLFVPRRLFLMAQGPLKNIRVQHIRKQLGLRSI